MRERSQTTPRRRGPKHPLPTRDSYEENFETSEPPYYSIDNTEEIYGTNLLPSQRCYVDPWDLENYDYVRKKLDSTPSPNGYYETSLSPSPAGEPVPSKYYYMPHPQEEHLLVAPRMSATMPRKSRRASHFQCELECCVPPTRAPRRQFEMESRGGLYSRGGVRAGQYDDYMLRRMADEMQLGEDGLEQNIYTGYGGFSSSSSNERHSSIGDESISTLMLHTPGFGAMTARRRSVVLPKPAPKLEFPAPPPMSPVPVPVNYDPYGSNPYATLPYCSVSDCYECLYSSPSIYGALGGGPGTSTSIYGGSSTLGRRPASSLYGGIYANKFGLSKKGLLQIDYSCSWNDLDRVIRRNY